MSKRVILIGWHFAKKISIEVGKGNINQWDRSKTGGQICQMNPIHFKKNGIEYDLYLIAYDRNEFQNDDSKELNKEINTIITKNEDDEMLVFLHDPPWKKEQFSSRGNTVICIHSGSDSVIYGDDGILDHGKNCFNYGSLSSLPWDNFWNCKYIRLSKKKNDLIKLWLPLAIDIQGLSEVNDKTGYLNEVEEAWKEDDIEKLFDDHNDIIDSIEDKNINKFKIDENNGNYQNIYQLKNIKGNIDKLINSDEDYFLPNFLHKLIETTDKIIEKQNN